MADELKPEEAAIRKNLELLNEQMLEHSKTANAFLAKFMFGGMVATMAILNADVLFLRQPLERWGQFVVLAAGSLLVAILSYWYFSHVEEHYATLRGSVRKLKNKYELTLAALLLGGSPRDYQVFLETGLDKERTGEEFAPAAACADYRTFATNLILHHSKKLKKDGDQRTHTQLAMLIVVLTMVVRLSVHAASSPLFAR